MSVLLYIQRSVSQLGDWIYMDLPAERMSHEYGGLGSSGTHWAPGQSAEDTLWVHGPELYLRAATKSVWVPHTVQ